MPTAPAVHFVSNCVACIELIIRPSAHKTLDVAAPQANLRARQARYDGRVHGCARWRFSLQSCTVLCLPMLKRGGQHVPTAQCDLPSMTRPPHRCRRRGRASGSRRAGGCRSPAGPGGCRRRRPAPSPSSAASCRPATTAAAALHGHTVDCELTLRHMQNDSGREAPRTVTFSWVHSTVPVWFPATLPHRNLLCGGANGWSTGSKSRLRNHNCFAASTCCAARDDAQPPVHPSRLRRCPHIHRLHTRKPQISAYCPCMSTLWT